MRYPIWREIFSRQRFTQSHRLLKREAHALAGDSVHGKSRIAHQRDIPMRHAARVFQHCLAAGFFGSAVRIAQTPRHHRKMSQRTLHAHLRIARQHRQTDFMRPGRRHINLATLAPIHFDKIAPRSNRVVAAETQNAPNARAADPAQTIFESRISGRQRPPASEKGKARHRDGHSRNLIP